MGLILNIDTSNEIAYVTLALGETILSIEENTIQKDHANFLHPAIKSTMERAGKKLIDLDAIAVTAGPGSYTGIRVGLATAKGLCYSLKKPLITINSLDLLVENAKKIHHGDDNYLYCPMIDARRMEVYTAMYDKNNNTILSPTALVIDGDLHRKFSTTYKLVLFGSGAAKCKQLSIFADSIFIKNVNLPQAMVDLSSQALLSKAFTDLILSDPIYLKEFFNK